MLEYITLAALVWSALMLTFVVVLNIREGR